MKDKNTSIPINQDEIQLYLKDIRRIKVKVSQVSFCARYIAEYRYTAQTPLAQW